ncbi:unnamed protein product, partial [Nesidiocoris tenuis]
MLNTYLSLRDPTGFRNDAALKPSHDTPTNNTFLVYANDRSSSPKAYPNEPNRKATYRSKLKDKNMYDDARARNRDEYDQHGNIPRHTYVGYHYPKRSLKRKKTNDYNRHVTFGNDIPHHDRGRPSNSPNVRRPSSNRRRVTQSRAPVHKASYQQRASIQKPSLAHHQYIHKPRGYQKDSLQLANTHFGSVSPHRSPPRRLRHQFALSRPRVQDSLLGGRPRRPSMVSTTLKRNVSPLHRPIHTTRYSGMRQSAAENFNSRRRRSRLVEHHAPMRRRHPLLAGAAPSDVYGRIDVKDFIDFLSSISRNTI